MIVEERDGIYEEADIIHGYYKGHYFHEYEGGWDPDGGDSFLEARYPESPEPEFLIIPRQFL